MTPEPEPEPEPEPSIGAKSDGLFGRFIWKWGLFHGWLWPKVQRLLKLERLFESQEELVAKRFLRKMGQLSNELFPLKREGRSQAICELRSHNTMQWGDVEENYFYELVRKSEKSDERRVAENANIILDAEMAHDIEPAWKYLESALEMHNAKLGLFTQENLHGKCCSFITLLRSWRKRRCFQATGEGLDEGLHHCDVYMRDFPEKYCHDLVRKPSRTGSRKTDKISPEILCELSLDLGEVCKNLGRALGVREAAIDQADEENQNLLEKCYNILLLWRKRLELQATYEALEAVLCHGSVERKDLAKKYYYDVDS